MPLSPGGIALLAPTGAELWRYERALEQRGLPIASQAGKSLFRRQGVQDLLALARVLADAGDTLAFAARSAGWPDRRGSAGHHRRASRASRSSGRDPSHPLARRTLSILQDLRRRAGNHAGAAPAEAAERLGDRHILAAREGDGSARAAANVEAFLERVRPYGVRGLKKLIRDLAKEWRDGAPNNEGRVDAEGDAIEIITKRAWNGRW